MPRFQKPTHWVVVLRPTQLKIDNFGDVSPSKSLGQRATKWMCVYVCVYTVCLFISHASQLILFSSLFPYLSPPLLIFSYENRPAPFPQWSMSIQAGCHKRRLNLAFSFFVYYFVLFSTFILVNACFCCIRFSFFDTKPITCSGANKHRLPAVITFITIWTIFVMTQKDTPLSLIRMQWFNIKKSVTD